MFQARTVLPINRPRLQVTKNSKNDESALLHQLFKKIIISNYYEN